MTDPQNTPWTLTARWIFPVSGLPLEHGTVTIAGDRITAVNARGECPADVDLGNVAVLPGLVNAHTHLDLTGLRGQAPPSPDFTAWLRQVIAHRRSRTSERVNDDIRAGLAECLRYGTTLLGDISGDGGSWDVLAEAPLRAVVFRELLGLPPNRTTQAITNIREWLATSQANATCRPALSPHAPYSASERLFMVAGRFARFERIPIAVHLAETAAELELLQYRSGPFVAFLEGLGVWAPEELIESTQRVMDLCDQKIPQLYIHGNYLDPSGRIPRRSTIVYCPRTHAAFGHPPHPFREFLKRGVRVALGTDSLASNPDLDVLAEMRFLHARHPDVPGDVILRMGTLSGAEALGWCDDTGSLTPGKSADLVVLPLPTTAATDPYWPVLQSTLQVSRVLWRGRWVSETTFSNAPGSTA
jgi:aminodeoxyfutalosine deaminase